MKSSEVTIYDLSIHDLQMHIEASISGYLDAHEAAASLETCHLVLDSLKEVARTWQATLEDIETGGVADE